MKTLLSLKTKRDVLLGLGIFILVLLTWLILTLTLSSGTATSASVYYGSNKDAIVTIDFVSKQVSIHYYQETGTDQRYPYIDLSNQTITLLGDYEVNGIRQVVVITYDLEKQSVQITEEKSPYQVCSKQGEITSGALICLPNRVRVEFKNAEEDFIL
jgi:hypothetical protein